MAEFKAGLGGMDDTFAHEQRRQEEAAAEREALLRRKACESKNRYSSRTEAQQALTWSEQHGAPACTSTVAPTATAGT